MHCVVGIVRIYHIRLYCSRNISVTFYPGRESLGSRRQGWRWRRFRDTRPVGIRYSLTGPCRRRRRHYRYGRQSRYISCVCVFARSASLSPLDEHVERSADHDDVGGGGDGDDCCAHAAAWPSLPSPPPQSSHLSVLRRAREEEVPHSRVVARTRPTHPACPPIGRLGAWTVFGGVYFFFIYRRYYYVPSASVRVFLACDHYFGANV